VISIETGTRLDEFRGLRHVVRNVYTHRFDPAILGHTLRDNLLAILRETSSPRSQLGPEPKLDANVSNAINDVILVLSR
jgi:hypothetical protein